VLDLVVEDLVTNTKKESQDKLVMRVCDPKCQGNSNANLCVVCYPPQNEGKNKGVFIIPNEIRLLRVDNLSISNRATECCK